jgi:hypothetical protein
MHREVMIIGGCMMQKIWQDLQTIHSLEFIQNLSALSHSAPHDERRETDVNRRLSEAVSMHLFIPCSGGHHAPP